MTSTCSRQAAITSGPNVRLGIKIPVHHIPLNAIDSSCFQSYTFFSQARKIRWWDRRDDLNRAIHVGDRSLGLMSTQVNIYDLAVGGEGVGRLQMDESFVAGVALNDELVVSITEEKSRYARAEILRSSYLVKVVSNRPASMSRRM